MEGWGEGHGRRGGVGDGARKGNPETEHVFHLGRLNTYPSPGITPCRNHVSSMHRRASIRTRKRK